MRKSLKRALFLLGISSCIFGLRANAQNTADNLFDNQENKYSLSERWELGRDSQKSTFTITPYKPIYILPGRWNNRPNDKPTSLNPENNSKTALPFQPWELKFQLSFKTKVAQGLIFGKGDIWLAFTQTANWQAYNEPISRPFRELNYEPEIIFNYPINWSIGNFDIVMAGVGFNHQSNGKSLPESRSWNRVIFQLGMEYENWSFVAKPWFRLKEKKQNDDNPKISDYIGRAELLSVYSFKGNVLSLMIRSNMRFNSHYKGYMEFTWAYPIKDNLKLYFTASNGYGDALIDYNWSQTNLGIGISLIEW